MADPVNAVAVRHKAEFLRDALLGTLVMSFAFLAASFTARNSDLWRHLATGRLLAAGELFFGTDPFGYTTDRAYWADHAWLSELVLYEAYAAVGGGGLVALKASLVALTAGLMLAAARGPGPFWVAAGTVLLAVLTLSDGLLLQPAVGSLCLLALCLWLFRRGGRAHWALPLAIAVWVNVDDWYVLGPLLVGLGCAGQWLEPRADAPRPVVWLLPACLVAGLVSPFHVRGLTLPPELSPAVWSSGLANDPRFSEIFASPWRAGPLGPAGGYDLAAWAFWALLGLGLVSFTGNRRQARGWRRPVWLGFALLACWQARFIPFFAVIAGPITALNLRESFPDGFLRRPGRALTGVMALVLSALTWPGWLQGLTARDRGLAWAVAPDPSLEHAARTVRQWRADHALPPSVHTLATHPDLAHHLVWFCPGERVMLDGRLGLFADTAPEFEGVSRALGLVQSGSVAAGMGAIRDHSVGRVLLYDPDARRMTAAVRQMAAGSESWELMAVEGGVVVVRPGGSPVGGSAPAFSPVRQAFGPTAEVAPVTGVTLAADAPPVWERRNRPRRASAEGGSAFVYLRMFEARADPDASPATRSPALPLLAARAARTAVAAGPGDDGAWVSLAQATLYQSRATWEAEAGRGCPLVARLRHAQVAAALVQAVIARPDAPAAHEALAGLYGERNFLDLAFRHRRAHVRLVGQAGPGPGESSEAFADRVARLTTRLNELENSVQDAENRFLVRTHGQAGDPLARARAAAGLGLAGRALEILTTSHVDLYGTEGLRLLLELLVGTGQAADARALLDREELRGRPDVLGNDVIAGGVQDGRPWSYVLHAYDWFDLLQSAAAGRYGAASGAATRLRARLQAQEAAARRVLTPQAAHQLASQVGTIGGPGGVWALPFAAGNQDAVETAFAPVLLSAAARADLHVLEGLLHLERGTTGGAAEQFDAALRVYATEAAAARVQSGRRLADRYRRAIQGEQR